MKRDKSEDVFARVVGAAAILLGGMVIFFQIRYGRIIPSVPPEEVPHLRVFHENGHPDRLIITVEVGNKIIRLKQEGEP